MDNVVRAEVVPVTGSQRFRALLGALLCVLFLLNLTGGWTEIPDCLPVVGNLDEVAVTVLLLRCLGRLGVTGLPGQR
jgi:hypothetical protein